MTVRFTNIRRRALYCAVGILLLALFPTAARAADALFSEPRILTREADLCKWITAADLNGDAIPDVLTASYMDNKIAWHENRLKGPERDFGPQQIITTAALGPRSVHAADLDSDGDMDVLYASSVLPVIAWHENRLNETEGGWGPMRIIESEYTLPVSVYSADLDGDGATDVISASFLDNMVAWHPNTSPRGTFGKRRIISSTTEGPRMVYAADMNGDGRPDVLSATSLDNAISWFPNRLHSHPEAPFPRHVMDGKHDGVNGVFAADLDGDGNRDILGCSVFDGRIAWYQNRLNDPEGDFGPQRIVSSALEAPQIMSAADVDGDGDTDVLAVSSEDNTVAWFENLDGKGTFGPPRVITTEMILPLAVHAADLNGDGAPDALYCSGADKTAAWSANLRLVPSGVLWALH